MIAADTFREAKPLHKPVDNALLCMAMTAYLEVWNMDCSHCGIWVRNALLQLDGVFIADVLLKYGIVAVTYDPARLTTDDLFEVVAAVGKDVCRYYGASLIGEEPAVQALHLDRLDRLNGS